MNKTDKFNDNNKVPVLCNHSSSETTVEKKINVQDNSSGANFSNLLISVKNIYNCDPHPWPKNTILIAGYSMNNGINEKRFSANLKSVNFFFYNEIS